MIDLVLNWGDPEGEKPEKLIEDRDALADHLQPLIDRPGEWAEIARSYHPHAQSHIGPLVAAATSIAGAWQAQIFRYFGRWDTAVRIHPSHASLYVRYLGSRRPQ